MSLPDDQKAAIRSTIASLQERTSFDRHLQNKILQHQRESSRAGAEYRQRILQKVYEAAGVDSSEILRRQKFEDSSAKKFLDSLVPGVVENAKAVKERHAAQFKWTRHKPFPGPPPPPPQPPISAVLTFASDISFEQAPELANVITTAGLISDENNLIRIKVSGDTEHSHSLNDYNCYMSFYWTPPRDGLLDVTTLVAVNGSHSWSSQHKCVEADVQQTAGAVLYVGNSVDLLLVDAGFFVDFDWSKFPGCATDTGMEVVDEFYTFGASGNSAIQVFANQPVVIAIVVNVEILNQDAHSSMDFYTGDQSINVPAVFLTLR